MIERLKRLARRLLGRIPSVEPESKVVAAYDAAKAQGPKRSRVYETAAERDVRLRARNVAYEAEKAKRRVLWEGGHRPPPSTSRVAVPDHAYEPESQNALELVRSAEQNMLDVIGVQMAVAASRRDKCVANQDWAGAAANEARRDTLGELLEELESHRSPA